MNRTLILVRGTLPILTLAVVLTTMLPLDAGAKVKRSRSALIRCTVEMTTPDGSTLTIRAWGPDEITAREQAQRVALLTAEIQVMPEAWIGLFFEGSDERKGFAAQLASVPTEPEGVAPAFPVPGFSLAEAACSAQELPVSRAPSNGWVATWPQGTGETFISPDPAVAVEAARRRSCLTSYQTGLGAMWEGLIEAPPDEVRTRYVDGWKGARDDAVACLTADGPGVEPAPGVEQLPASSGGWVECTAREPFPNEHATAARGWSRSTPWAIESALVTLPYAVSRSTFGVTAETVTDAAPEVRAQLVAAQAQRLTRMLVSDAAHESLQIQCLDVPTDADAALGWTSEDEQLALICEPQGGWSVARQPLADGTPTQALQALQMRLVFSYLGVARLAWEAADMDPAVAITGRGIVALCEASSLADSQLGGDASTPLPLPGAPDRMTSQAAQAVLDQALAGRNILLLLDTMHPDLRVATAEGFERQGADGFWPAMTQLFPEAIGGGELVWIELATGWVLAEP